MIEKPRSPRGVPEILRELGVEQFIDDASQVAVTRELTHTFDESINHAQPEKLVRFGQICELKGLDGYDSTAHPAEGSNENSSPRYFELAFQCWRALATLPTEGERVDNSVVSLRGIELVSRELLGEALPPREALSIRLAVAGLVAGRTAETRLTLGMFDFSTGVPTNIPWRDQVARLVATAVVQLVRKSGGWTDVDAALSSIGTLRQLQEEYENGYIDSIEEPRAQTAAALELVGLYHLAQCITIVGEYLRSGQDSITQVMSRLSRHHDRARTAFIAGQRSVMAHYADLVWVGSRELARNAIWTHISGMGERVKSFGRLLADRGRPNPVLELWPSQQEALRRNLLDPYKRAVLVEMPTSAGKTLLAKFAIVQDKALNPVGTVAYIVPTRALVNQVTLDLRADLGLLGLVVEQAVPATELDPTEDRLLGQSTDVLVSTPEKLDLLMRRGHPVTQRLSLVIADEAHNLRDGQRGARLEMLLGIIKRDRADARFLLLSPFLPNDLELVTWLGDERALAPIRVNWRPGRRVVAAVEMKIVKGKPLLVLETLPAAGSLDVDEGKRVVVGAGPAVRSIKELTKSAVEAFRDRGTVLVLCRGPGTAMTRAEELAGSLPTLADSAEREAVSRYLEAEVGRTPPLVEWMRRGVACHHAGLSLEAKWLIEGLIRRNEIRVVCGTTTLAQGVNFPISTVIVETLQKGSAELSYEDFWNIAGRAGRALIDTLGIVLFPAPTKVRKQECVEFLRREAEAISSQLTRLIDRVDEIVAGQFGMSLVANIPELSSFMQFLAHAVHVSGDKDIAEDVEDILRASLVYRQAQRQGEESVRSLVRLCRAYLKRVEKQGGVVALADETGFTTPSILLLRQMTAGRPELQNVKDWDPETLFGQDVTPLKDRVQAIAQLPEIRLGAGIGQPFNPARVASIIRDWVNGETLGALSERYPISEEQSADKRLAEFSKYLFSELLGRASWGLGALETVTLAGKKEVSIPENMPYVPSMVYFGVNRKEAVWLRMVGVPRVAANGLGELWRKREAAQPESYSQIRDWVSNLSDKEWRESIAAGSRLEPKHLRFIWKEFLG